ncbi:glycoside hydrolase family 95 protein [Lacticaseibacillus parakribbianus]|uniref:glycoside hydrolase family 95 protein n=1 Tax=Lacticaseibacillus parakribbianus TaxID=2970927 RepID=UPI0021CB3238|nr:glycoside hydrolase family 95 protein [Lacticaseibacillus parakribbianus]
MTNLLLHYDHPALQWEESLPLGNGSLGAMVWGTVGREVIGLNEETLWSGYPRDKNNPQAFAHLQEVRRLIFDQQYEKAEAVIAQSLLGENNESYLPMGNLIIDGLNQSIVTNYHRSLDLTTAVASVDYDMGGAHLHREAFVSHPAQALIIRLQGPQSFQLKFESELAVTVEAAGDTLSLSGQCPEHVDPEYHWEAPQAVIQGTRGIRFAGAVRILATDGRVNAYHGTLDVHDSHDTVIAVSCVRKPQLAGDYAALKAQHVADYQRLFGRVALNLDQTADETAPTDVRLARVRDGATDLGLVSLYFQYGRYLLIASAREDSALPPTLQGIWNWQLRAPWSSNWTVNINLQMNYWLAHVGNLEEAFPPYLRLMRKIVTEGQKTAAINYHAKGFVAHHNIDAWGSTNPVGINFGDQSASGIAVWWAMWPMGGAWLASELFSEYRYTKDQAYLKGTVYPMLREAMLFLNDWLVDRGDGTYTTCPSSSPENQFITPRGNFAGMTESVALDRELVRSTFRDFRRTCEILAIDDPLIAEFAAKLAHYPDVEVGEDGRLLEWNRAFPEREPGHRHMTPVWGLFPGDLFSKRPDLQEACRKLIEHRLANLDVKDQIGWSCAWLISLYAVLGDGDKAGAFVQRLLQGSTLNNLWDSCPPFQIDGNFGGAAGIANMLVQDREDGLKILPALPAAWTNGHVAGLRLTAGRTIDITWADHKLVDYQIHEAPVAVTGGTAGAGATNGAAAGTTAAGTIAGAAETTSNAAADAEAPQ